MKKTAILIALATICSTTFAGGHGDSSPTFTGSCEANFAPGNTKIEMVIPAETAASICVPPGWKIHSIGNTKLTSGDWQVERTGLKNVVLIRPADDTARTANWWIYPLDWNGDSPVRFELTTRTK